MASQMGDPTIFDLLFVILLLSATASVLLLCRYLNTRDDGTRRAPTSDRRPAFASRTSD
ncbi:hypothetical protein [Mycolicibacterium iranicum]|uniref:hypothetical protein n=1 Tax=Mycolicibacterium iranicum TaxID=912594 RepID=UPI0013FDF9BE|nr:hypothetical protein [Mycolicibacterium iranicum]